MISHLRNYTKEAINLGTQNQPLSDQPATRLVNAIGLLANLTVIITEIMLLIFVGFEWISILSCLFYLILFSGFLYFNYLEKWEWSKNLVVAGSICVVVTLHFSYPRDVASWVFSICDFVLFAAIFKKNKQVFLFGGIIIALAITSIVVQNSPGFRPLMKYPKDDVMVLQIIIFVSSSVFVLLGVLFVRSNLLDHQQQLERIIDERNLLLKEIHHRVKNNLQVIASLLFLQSEKTEDVSVKKRLEEGYSRICSMALIHQKLYEIEDLSNIPFNEYLNELIIEIQNSFGECGKNVKIEIQAHDVHFKLDVAIPLGLIINELTTNAFKYAFANNFNGCLSIKLWREDFNFYKMSMSDNGKGIPDDKLNNVESSSLGLRLIRILCNQLEGEHTFSNTNGTTFELKFAI